MAGSFRAARSDLRAPSVDAELTWVLENALPGDQVVVADDDLGEYYLGERPIHYGDIDWQEPFATRVWFVVDDDARIRYPQEVAWIQEHSRLMAIFDVTVPGRIYVMRVYLYTPDFDSG